MKYPRWESREPSFLLREIDRNIYVGASSSVVHMPWRAVIDLMGASGGLAARAYEDCAGLLRLPVEDCVHLEDSVFEACVGFVDLYRRSGPVLIHCMAGLNRSASVGYAALRMLHGYRHDKALSRVRAQEGFPLSATLDSARAWVYEQSVSPASSDASFYEKYLVKTG